MPGLRWTFAEKEELRKQLAAGHFLEDIYIEGKTKNAIRAQATRLGLIGDGVARVEWSEEDKEDLFEYVKDGWSASDIVEAMEIGVPVFRSGIMRNRNAIQKQMQRLGLGNKKRSRVLKTVRHFTGNEKREFRSFLKANYESMTPEQMAREWIKKHPSWRKEPNVLSRLTKRVRRHLVEMDCKLSRAEIVKMPYSRKKARHSRAKAERRKNRKSKNDPRYSEVFRSESEACFS